MNCAALHCNVAIRRGGFNVWHEKRGRKYSAVIIRATGHGERKGTGRDWHCSCADQCASRLMYRNRITIEGPLFLHCSCMLFLLI